MHPDEVVALGAAIQGGALRSTTSDVILLDVTPHALGIMTFGGYFEELIPQHDGADHDSADLHHRRDNQTAVKILVMQGESESAEDNELLGEFILTGLPPAPRGGSRSR